MGPPVIFLLMAGMAGLCIVAFWIRSVRARRRGFTSRPVASLLLFIPGVRGLVMQDNFTVIAGALEKLLLAGIPLDAALKKASAGDLTPVYARMLRRVHGHVLEGESFTNAFQMASSGLLMPKSFIHLVSVGEQANMLPEALCYLHTFYRTQASTRARILTGVLQPLGVLALGLVTLAYVNELYGMLFNLTSAFLDSM